VSYLDVPRFHFNGRFLTDPSTINNNIVNFNPATLLSDPTDPQCMTGVGWNPSGGHNFKVTRAVVRSAIDAKGAVSSSDPIVGGLVVSTDAPYPAKMVDLDPDQQFIPQVIGLQLRLSLADGTPLLTGTVQPIGSTDMWIRVSPMPANGSRECFSSAFQSVLTDLTWTDAGRSPILAALKALSPTTLSLRFMLDGYQWQPTAADFTYGRIVGSIGPVRTGEPSRFVAGRRIVGKVIFMTPAANAFVDTRRSVLTLDLGNALSTTSAGGPVITGEIDVVVSNPAGPNPTSYTPIGTVPVTTATYDDAAGIVDLPLNASQLGLVSKLPISLNFAGSPFIAEDPSGLYVDVETPGLRMNPGDSAAVRALALSWGQALPSYTLNLGLTTGQYNPSWDNDPPSALQILPSSVTTDATGWATINLTAGDPSPKPTGREFIDGQVYFLGGEWTNPGRSAQIAGNGAISVKIFDSFTAPSSPTWSDVQPILADYARLFPGMTTFLDLSNYDAIKPYGNAIAAMLTLGEDDPRYMPVTRDLSRAKSAMIVQWIRAGLPR
jgi:hypothetical protein